MKVCLLVHDLGNSDDVEIVKLFYPRWRETPDGVKKGSVCIKGKRTEEQLICMLVKCGTAVLQRHKTVEVPPTVATSSQPSLAARRPRRSNAGVNKRIPDVGDNREILAKRKRR